MTKKELQEPNRCPTNVEIISIDTYLANIKVWGNAIGELWDHRKKEYITKKDLPEQLQYVFENFWEVTGDDYLAEYRGEYFYMMDFIYNHNAKENAETWNDVFEKALSNAMDAAASPELEGCQVLVVKSRWPQLDPHTVSVLIRANETRQNVKKIRNILEKKMLQ